MLDGWSDLLFYAMTIASTAMLLAVGVVVGYNMGLRTAAARSLVTIQPVSLPIAAGTQTAEEFLTAELERCLEAARALPGSEELGKELTLIIQAVTNLSQQLKASTDERRAGGTALARSEPAAIDDTNRIASRSSTLSVQELQHFTATQVQVASESDNALRRYPYDCYQLVAPWDEGDACPAADSTRRVRCHDISGDGVSFFWPVEPSFDRLLIMLGTSETPTAMLAKVAHFRPVFMHGNEQFLVGCQFLQRLDHQPPLREQPELVYGDA